LVARTVEWLDGTLGRLIFRAIGCLCSLVALACFYLALQRLADQSVAVALLFGIGTIAAGSVVPYCFSPKRSLGEALDGLEGGAGDTRRRDTRA
jgi:hypothetical protein